MKKLLLLMLAALLIASCQKKEMETTPALQDVSFKAIQIIPDAGLKSTANWECKDEIATHAWVVINEKDYYPQLFELDGALYTQAIKLPVLDGNNPYCLETFVLYAEVNGIPGYQLTEPETDVIVFGTPMGGTHYAEYVTRSLDYCFDVDAFVKEEIDIQVLCFQNAEYNRFGFDWFAITEIVIRQQCFFGDICIADATLYENEPLYSLGGVDVDEEAVVRVIVKEGGFEVPYSPFDNEEIYGDGKVLCVDYPDNLSVEETFTFELQVWVPSTVPGTFAWQTYATFTTTDDNPIPEAGEDGVVDFAIGTCSPDSNPIFDWLPAPVPSLVVVTYDDLATGYLDPGIAYKWFFYNDETDLINSALGSFVAGPNPVPAGTGSAQVSVTGTERVCLATFQFGGTPLADITTFAFSTYNPSVGNGGSTNRSGYLNFNIDFDGTDTWQMRLVYIPSDNGTVTPDSWQEWDVIDGGSSIWRWSGALWGGAWPGGSLNPTEGKVTLNQILAAYPGISILASNPFVGVRVGEPYNDGYTENIDAFKFGTGTTSTVYDFEN